MRDPGEITRTSAAVPLHRPFYDEAEAEAAKAVVESGMVQGGGLWLSKAEDLLRTRLGARHALLTTSCTHALEAAAMALDIGAGDEVVVPTYGFPTSAGAYIRQGARVVFADSERNDPRADIDALVDSVTSRTRAIVVVHYAGRPFDVPRLRRRLGQRPIAIIEDAAQAFDSRLDGRACGLLGDIGCISFHGTKNLTCGEGGLLLTNDDEIARRLVLIREMGTDRRFFMAGEAETYSWRALGSSFLPSEIAASILCAQIAKADVILESRRRIERRYREGLSELARRRTILLPGETPGASGNAHIFWVTFRDRKTRDRVRAELDAHGIEASPHFHPLDTSPFGKSLMTRAAAPLVNAQRFHDCLLRLPLYPQLRESEQDRIVDVIKAALGNEVDRRRR